MLRKNIFKGTISKSGQAKWRDIELYWERRGDEIWFTIDEVYECRYDGSTVPA